MGQHGHYSRCPRAGAAAARRSLRNGAHPRSERSQRGRHRRSRPPSSRRCRVPREARRASSGGGGTCAQRLVARDHVRRPRALDGQLAADLAQTLEERPVISYAGARVAGRLVAQQVDRLPGPRCRAPAARAPLHGERERLSGRLLKHLDRARTERHRGELPLRLAEVAAADELADDVLDVRDGLAGKRPEPRHLVEPVLPDTLGIGPMERIGHQRTAKTAAGGAHEQHRLARDGGHILRFGGIGAVGAVTTTTGRPFRARGGTRRAMSRSGGGLHTERALVPKVAQYVRAQASRGLAVALHCGEQAIAVLPCPLARIIIQLALIVAAIDQIAPQPEVVAVPEQMTLRRVTVAPSTACLLVVRLDALGHVVVDHIAHVGLVDPHAKRIGRHDNGHKVVDKRRLVLSPLVGSHTRMVAPHADARRRELASQRESELIHRPARRTVDDS